MKKRVLALVCAMVLTMGMSLNVCAAGSATASSNSSSGSSDTPLTTATQKFSETTLEEFANTTTVKSGSATIGEVSYDTAAEAIAEAKKAVGENAFVATVVDLKADKAGSYTIGCPNVWKGQKVTIIHQKADNTWEYIKPTKVADNEVTFTLNSFSPVAVVIDTTSGKTGDSAGVVAAMAVVCLAGVVICGKKRVSN